MASQENAGGSGLLVVFPHCNNRNPPPQELTQLHLRDRSNISHASPGALDLAPPDSKIVRECRFSLISSGEESNDKQKPTPYLYTTHATDLRIFRSKAYLDDVSRRLDLENTREPKLGEQPVNEGVKEGTSVSDLAIGSIGVFREVRKGRSRVYFHFYIPSLLPFSATQIDFPFAC